MKREQISPNDPEPIGSPIEEKQIALDAESETLAALKAEEEKTFEKREETIIDKLKAQGQPPVVQNIDIWNAADKKVQSIDVQLKQFAGKPGYNPFTWARDNNWEGIKEGIKNRDSSALELLQKLPNIINPRVNPNKVLPAHESFYKPKDVIQ